ncbi:hypothetical protein [Sporomusa aerivorans]|uniref:hypothetical protein n=1 Tax=Sporomusa aerivorans TaxID=204936 RepID=UPI00352AEDE5
MYNIVRWGSRVLAQASPVMLVATGAALALALPPVRKGLRSAAILATRGILNISDQVQHTGAAIKEEVEDIVAEAREIQPAEALSNQFKELKNDTRKQLRQMAVTATGGALALSDHAQSLRQKVQGMVDEAKEEHLNKKDENRTEAHDGLEPV